MSSNENNQEENRKTLATFEEVLYAEIKYFEEGQAYKKYTDSKYDDATNACDSEYAATVLKKAHKMKLSGIAFSGGGIRSATFNLGILQALARFKLIKDFDYLSTVSGGGYIGSWLAAWINREGVDDVTSKLAAASGEEQNGKPHGAVQPDPPPIHHLREYSNYLTPRCGALSTDAWTFGAAYIRNLFLTLSVLLGTVAAVVLLAQACAYLVAINVPYTPDSVWTWPYIIFTILLSITSILLGFELSPRQVESAQNPMPAYFAVALCLAAAMSGSLWLSTPNPTNNTDTCLGFPLDTLYLMSSIMICGLVARKFGNYAGSGDAIPGAKKSIKRPLTGIIIASVFSLLTLVVLWQWLAPWMRGWNNGQSVLEKLPIVVWGMPVVVATFGIAAAVFVGCAGQALKELEREWLARFFAALAKWTFLYTLFMALVVYSSYNPTESMKDSYLKPAFSGLWAIMSTAGAYLARNTPSLQSNIARILRRLFVAISPYVFILGLLIITVWGTTYALHTLQTLLKDALNSNAAIQDTAWYSSWPFLYTVTDVLYGHTPDKLLTIDGYWKIAVTAGLFLLGITFCWSLRVGVNNFSMHALYGNRLIRAYLGASNLDRHANPFSGFASSDNSLHMADLISENNGKNTKCGPYLIINTAINLVHGHRLAWQQRKAASFTFTPQYCGYEFCDTDNNTQTDNNSQAPCIYRTGGYARSKSYGGEEGISLGKAMTISGAAASPNMGYHSSPALSFLMTTFNVRLGWWLPNTNSALYNTNLLHKLLTWLLSKHTISKTDLLRKQLGRLRPYIDKTIKDLLGKRGPTTGLMYLINEALGLTDARRKYVYLSDGGHFENLGIYELVRRRCRFVIACDAEADPDLTFSGLGNAIEKCRTDLGVPIHIDVTQIRRVLDTGKSRWHCAIGCIRYSEADAGHHDGTLLYIKASLTGDEPQDVATYANKHQSFPHESTVDQWFDESQFESYRELGEHCATMVLTNADKIAKRSRKTHDHPLDRIFLELRKQWYPHSEPAEVKPADHDRLLEELLERLRGDSKLTFLDSQLYPNLQRVADKEWPPEYAKTQPDAPRPPADSDELRSGFYFCKELIQFMQSVFHGCQLDTEYRAPSNRGWMNLFRRWALSSMFRFTWAATAGTYSARFQSFCEFHLNLDTGEPCVDLNNTQQLTPEEVSEWVDNRDNMGLHRYERWVIHEFITACAQNEHIKALGKEARFTIYPLKLKVDNVFHAIGDKQTQLNAGFFIVGPSLNTDSIGKPAVLFFRIRASMRNMDLARKAFIKIRLLKETPDLVKLVRKPPNTPEPTEEDSLCLRAHREVHDLEKENMDRCHWFSQFLEDTMRINPGQETTGKNQISDGACSRPTPTQ